MASNERKLVLEIQWKDGKIVTREIEKTADSMKKLEKETDAVDKALSKVKIGAAAAGAAILVVAKKSMDEFIKGQDAILMMEGALQALGKYTPTASKRMQDLASAIQKVSRYGRADLLPYMSEFLTVGKLQENQLERSMKAAMDFAVITGSLGTATMPLAKAAAGNTTMLARYGLILDEDIPKAQKFEAALQWIETRMGGLEQKMSGGLGGAFKQTTNAIGDMLEEGFKPWEVYLQSILGLTRDVANAATRQMQAGSSGLQFGMNPFGAVAASQMQQAAQSRLNPNLKYTIPGMQFGFGGLASLPASQLAQRMSVVGGGGGGGGGRDMNIVGMAEFQRKQAYAFTTMRTDMIAKNKGYKKEMPGLMDLPYEMEGMTEPPEKDFSKLYESADTAQQRLQLLGAYFEEGLPTAFDRGVQRIDILVGGMQATFDSMWSAVISGTDNAAMAVLKSTAGMVGQMASEQGRFYFLKGLAAVFDPFSTVNGAGLIAAGTALMAFGSGLGAASRSGRGGASAGSGAGYNSSRTASDFGGYGNYNSGPRIVVITADGRNVASGTNVDTVLSRAGLDRQLRKLIYEQSRTGILALKAS